MIRCCCCCCCCHRRRLPQPLCLPFSPPLLGLLRLLRVLSGVQAALRHPRRRARFGRHDAPRVGRALFIAAIAVAIRVAQAAAAQPLRTHGDVRGRNQGEWRRTRDLLLLPPLLLPPL